MSVKLTYGYLTTINWFQYFLVFNLYRRMNKFEYIFKNSHTVGSGSCLHYLTIDNWFHNFHLFDLWTIWMYLLTYNLFSIQWFKDFSLVFIWFLLIDYTEKTSNTCLILYFRRKFYINNIIICRVMINNIIICTVMNKIITICRECLLNSIYYS